MLQTLPLGAPVALAEGESLHERIEAGRTWLLPVLRTNVRRASLGYFLERLLPVAMELFAMSEVRGFARTGKREGRVAVRVRAVCVYFLFVYIFCLCIFSVCVYFLVFSD